MNQLLQYYTVAVNHPNVSGFEHLEMPRVRDKLAKIKRTLSPTEKDQLEEADHRLAERANEFYAELARVTDLQYERDQRKTPPSHWWWYLDVLVQAPSLPPRRLEPALTPL
jgi:hypothetical protein